MHLVLAPRYLLPLFLLSSKGFSLLFVPQAGPWCRFRSQLSLENSWHIWTQVVAPGSNLLGGFYKVLGIPTLKHCGSVNCQCWGCWGNWEPG